MAINVNTVYQTVLLILNKEQRGYMTPVEFNKTGTQAQLEIFETYFDSLNQQIRIPQTDTDYADRVSNLDEKISIFKTSGNASYQNSLFNIPSQFSGSGKQQTTTTPANTTAATLSYTINGITAAKIADGVIVNKIRVSWLEISKMYNEMFIKMVVDKHFFYHKSFLQQKPTIIKQLFITKTLYRKMFLSQQFVITKMLYHKNFL